MLMLTIMARLASQSLSLKLVSKINMNTSLNSKRHQPTLFVVTPAYAQDIEQWSTYLASILTARENIDGGECSFGKTMVVTIVSDEHERAVFEKRLAKIQSSCGTNASSVDGIFIRSLQEVLRSTKAVDEDDMRFVTPSNLFLYQGTKKFYGCLDAASISGLRPKAGDACFMVDSDSRLLRNSFCHMASEYRKLKTVFFSPYPDANHIKHNDCIEYSRKVLGQNLATGDRDNTFGEFYAMESYHWVFDVQHVQAYLQAVPIAVLAVNLTKTPDMLTLDNSSRPPSLDPRRKQCIYPEEMMYHFLYPRRQAWGYSYVDVYDMLQKLVGASGFNTMVQSSNPKQAIMEGLTDRLFRLTREDAVAIGKALRNKGVLQVRCSRIGDENVQALMESMDMCGSLYTRRQEFDTSSGGADADIPACLSL